jgi:hypothetical protein
MFKIKAKIKTAAEIEAIKAKRIAKRATWLAGSSRRVQQPQRAIPTAPPE